MKSLSKYLSALVAILVLVAVVITAGIAPAAAGDAPEGPFAYVTNLGSDTVSVVDTATNTVIATVPVAYRPSWAATTPDGTRAYVTHDERNQVSVIDADPASLTFNTVVATPFVRASRGVAITPDGSRAYVTNIFTGSVSVLDIDPASPTFHKVVAIISGLGYAPAGIAITPDGTRAYVTHTSYHYDPGRVSVIDTDPASATYNTQIAIAEVGRYPYGVAITTDGTRAYVANPISNTVSVIDTATNTVTATLSIGASPIGVAITPDGNRAYMTHHICGTGQVSVVDIDPTSPGFHTVIATVGVGSSPFGVAITPDGAKAYVTNIFSDTTSVIDTTTATLITHVAVGDYPTSVAITPTLAPKVIPATIDIDPDALNLKSKGKFITCYIELPESYLVEDIDIDSVALTKINDDLLDPPLYTVGPSEIGDYDDDGIPDLMVKFNRQELIPLLEVGDEVEIVVIGELTDGTPFEGSDTIRVIDKGKGK